MTPMFSIKTFDLNDLPYGMRVYVGYLAGLSTNPSADPSATFYLKGKHITKACPDPKLFERLSETLTGNFKLWKAGFLPPTYYIVRTETDFDLYVADNISLPGWV